MSNLRARQRALGRQAIVEACAEFVNERHLLDFSMKEVAERAGVSLRTVYNHFASREDMLDALGHHFDQQLAALGGPNARELRSIDDVLDGVRRNLVLFEHMGGASEAMAQMPLADVGRDVERLERTRLIVDFLTGLMPEVPEPDARAVAVLLRHVLSHRSWFWLTREYGLTTEQVSGVVTWAITTLTEAARSDDLPFGKAQS